jgi:hypothetical protein
MERRISAVITTKEMKKKLRYKGTVMLTMEIEFPQVGLKSRAAQNRINTYYINAVSHFLNYAASELYPQAVTQYRDAQKNGFPFHAHEAVMHDTVTLNQNCTLSTYIDQYTFTGGAHGNTQRFSQSFHLQTGKRLQIADFFGPEWKCCHTLLEYITAAAAAEMKKDPTIFFENYRELLLEYFDPESFYLKPEGIVVYYQQYEIAPYASGIPVFEIPYTAMGAHPPACSPR